MPASQKLDLPIDSEAEIEEILKKHLAKIKVIGVGGAGNNTINRLAQIGVHGTELVAINTDAADLLKVKADRKVLIGRKLTNGLGAGADPRIGEQAAKEDEDMIKRVVSGADLVFVTCGLGGGTGTGAAPVVSQIIKESGVLCVGIVTLPFSAEGFVRMNNAKSGLERMRKSIDTLVILPNDRLMQFIPDVPINKAFTICDEILMNAVKGMTELITKPGLINVDFADVKTIMRDGGLGVIGIGESNSEERQVDAVNKAVKNPLLAVEITNAKNALVNVTGGEDLTLHQAHDVVKMVSEQLDPEAKVIWGAHIDPKLKDVLRVMIVVTGVESEEITPEVIPLKKKPKTEPEPNKLEEEFGLEVIVPKLISEYA